MPESALEGATTGRMTRIYPLLAPISVFTFYLSFCFVLGLKNKVNLVSGVDVAYEVHINSRRYELQPHEERLIYVPDGKVEVSYRDPNNQQHHLECYIDTPFLSRPFKDPIFVINPDRAAIIIHEEVFYGDPEAVELPGPRVKHHVGDLFYHFQDANVVFKDFPAVISVSSLITQDMHKLNRIAQPENQSVANGSQIMVQNGEDPWPFLKALLAFDTHNEAALENTIQHVDPAVAESFLKAELNIRPVNLAWHRSYQDLMRTRDPFLLDYYKGLLRQNPNDPKLKHLMLRLEPNPDVHAQLFTPTADPKVYAFMIRDQVYLDLAQGHYQKALDNCLTIANKFRPETIERLLEWCREAAGDFKPLLAKQTGVLEANPDKPSEFRKMVRLHTQIGSMDLDEIIEPFLKEAENWSSLSREEWARHFGSYYQYTLGNREAFAHDCALTSGIRFEKLLARNQFKDALDHVYEQGSIDPFRLIAISVLAHHEGDLEMASMTWDAAHAIMEDNPIHQLAMIQMEQGQDLSRSELPLNPGERALLQIVKAQRMPSQTGDAYAIAKRLNFRRSFPYMTVDRIVNPDVPTN